MHKKYWKCSQQFNTIWKSAALMQYDVVQYREIQCRLYRTYCLINGNWQAHMTHHLYWEKEEQGHAPFTDAKENIFDIISKHYTSNLNRCYLVLHILYHKYWNHYLKWKPWLQFWEQKANYGKSAIHFPWTGPILAPQFCLSLFLGRQDIALIGDMTLNLCPWKRSWFI